MICIYVSSNRSTVHDLYNNIIFRVFLNLSDLSATGSNQADWLISNLLFYGSTEMKPDGFDNNMQKFRNTYFLSTKYI